MSLLINSLIYPCLFPTSSNFSNMSESVLRLSFNRIDLVFVLSYLAFALSRASLLFFMRCHLGNDIHKQICSESDPFYHIKNSRIEKFATKSINYYNYSKNDCN